MMRRAVVDECATSNGLCKFALHPNQIQTHHRNNVTYLTGKQRFMTSSEIIEINIISHLLRTILALLQCYIVCGSLMQYLEMRSTHTHTILIFIFTTCVSVYCGSFHCICTYCKNSHASAQLLFNECAKASTYLYNLLPAG